MEHVTKNCKIQYIFKIQKTLLEAVKNGDLETISQMIELGVDINCLAEYKNCDVVKFLIHRGANVKHVECMRQNSCQSALISILKRGNCKDNSVVEIIQVLLENGASVNDKCGDGKTPLMLAAEKEGSVNVLELLLDHGAELGEVDEEGNTALILAACEGCSQNVSFLLQVIKNKKDLINLQNYDGLTALMFAVRFRNSNIIKELIYHGADVNIKDRGGNTALLHLSLVLDLNEEEIIQSLLEAGADINYQNDEGLSPLMVAAQNYFKNRICALLNSGAEINSVSKIDATKTALSHLLFKPHRDHDFNRCLKCLLVRGADASYIEATVLHRMILVGKVEFVDKLIWCGLGPASVFVNCQFSFTCKLYQLMNRYKTCLYDAKRDWAMSFSISGKDMVECFSPLSAALCAGNSVLANFFVRNLFLTQYDICLLGHNEFLRQYLERPNHKQCKDILNELSAQPMSLFNLSFVAVSTAVGASPGRVRRVNELEIPQFFKDKLLFQ